ncbi:13762_t:CDS:2 [Funneliformis mosseae]|uniref:13762_t:CDS:1 n=1 Tax=Funneliformis mosseae TaxID=27381 RepID=A0A9N9CUS3_FUNMO|nr:13762_t:CDS:2 [Funneliformis mosseae]
MTSIVSTVTHRDLILKDLNEVPFPPEHLDLKQILKTKPHRSKVASLKNAHIPKRTLNAFLLFRKECIEYLKKDKKVIAKQKFLSTLIADTWREQPAHVKFYYEDLAKQAKKLHKEMSPQIQIRLFDPKSLNNGKNKNDYMRTDEFIASSPTSSNEDNSVTFDNFLNHVTVHDQPLFCDVYNNTTLNMQTMQIDDFIARPTSSIEDNLITFPIQVTQSNIDHFQNHVYNTSIEDNSVTIDEILNHSATPKSTFLSYV